MYIVHTKTGQQISAAITKLQPTEFALIKKSNRFNFDWNKEKDYEVYKLTAEGVEEILGLVSLEERPVDYAFQIRLLASSKENIGINKKYQRIAGCLIAFVCEKSFKSNYEGYVFLKPKTGLEKHYKEVNGMISTPLFLITEGQNSLDLIKKYYED
jgi:hypothetical protein